MQGLILCAGEGRRLQPLTSIMAKPALQIIERPLIWYISKSLVDLSIDSIYVTLYHKADSVLDLSLDAYNGVPINYITEPILLGTGGGIKNATRFIKDDILLICNGDTLWDFDLEPVLFEHMTSGHDITLVLTITSEWQNYSAIRTNEHGKVVRIGTLAEINNRAGYLSPPYTFTGIYLLKTSLLKHLPNASTFDFVEDFIVPLMTSGVHIQGSIVKGFWADLGTFQRYLSGCLRFAEWQKGVSVNSVVGQNCSIGKGAEVIDSVFWNHVTIAPNAYLRNCIAVNQVQIDTPVQIVNMLLFPNTVRYSALAEFNLISVSSALAYPFKPVLTNE